MYTKKSGVKCLLEGFEGSPGFVNGTGEGTGGRSASILGFGRKVFPEEGVVDVATVVFVPMSEKRNWIVGGTKTGRGDYYLPPMKLYQSL